MHHARSWWFDDAALPIHADLASTGGPRFTVLLSGSPIESLAQYRSSGGLVALTAASTLEPQKIVDELTRSGLRGRGGAGFPIGLKWQTLLEGGATVGDRFVVANGAEGEPGTYKDRTLIGHNPYALIEGVLIAAQTLGARRTFIALKGAFETEASRVENAAAEFASAGLANDIQIELVRGPDEYLFGEEKALLEVIEGEEPLPRQFPPYIYGLFTTHPQMGWSAGSTLTDPGRAGSNPTLVNNVETLSTVPYVLARGADWYREQGTEESPGTIICTVSGDTVRHGVGEFEMGTPLAHALDELGGGMPSGRSIKYVLSGISNPVIRADHLDTPLTYEHFEAIGSGLGTGGFIVYDDRTDPTELARAVSKFLAVESCGQCPACKLGTARITELLDPSAQPHTSELRARLKTVTDSARCYLPTQEQRLVTSLLPDMQTPELAQPERDLLITKIIAMGSNNTFELDQTQRHKQPDWSYANKR